MQANAEASSSGRRFFGYVLIAAGGLLTLLSGACTLTWLGAAAFSTMQASVPSFGMFAGAFVMALPIGGLPITAGVAMIVGGRSLLKPPRPPPAPSSPLR